ncbi:MAG TPA: helix-turn-helix transcriptional regulator [Puia sp.]|jgi:ribosome-binding protein aMBF1 (putative translation factor)
MTLKEKLDKITSPNKSNWLQDAIKEQANIGARINSWKVAVRVLTILDEKGMTQTELAEKMGVSRQQVTKIVKGEENFTFETIDKLEKALGVTLITIAPREKPRKEKKQLRATVRKKTK